MRGTGVTEPLNWARRQSLMGLTLLSVLFLGTCLEQPEQDTIAPVVELTYPLNGATVFDKISLFAEASDNMAIFRVDFYIDGVVYPGTFVSGSTYKFEWNTTSEPDLSQHSIYARAFDNSSNASISATIYVTVNNQGRAPLAVTLHPVQSVGKHRLDLSWDQSIDREFWAYRLFRNTTNAWDSSAKLIADIRDNSVTTFSDVGLNADGTWVSPFGLDENTTYYYRLTVCDTALRESPSNVISATTNLPMPVVLKKDYQAAKDAITISWFSSNEDVSYYRVHRARYATVGENLADSIALVYPPQVSYRDTGLTALTKYYYRVFLIDSAGYCSNGSNIISAMTTDLPALQFYYPKSADIGKNSIRLTWSKSHEPDAIKYCLYRAKHSFVTNLDNLVATITNRSDTVYIDTGLQPATKYYYVVYHQDSKGNIKPSNEVYGTTLGMSDLPLAITNLGKYGVTLSWQQYPSNDFSTYKLYRGSYPDFDTSAADLKRIITTRNTVTFSDNNLARETVYYYQLIVRDNLGCEAVSKVSVVTRDIEAVTIKSVQNIAAQQKRITFTCNRLDTDFSRYEIYRDTTLNVDRFDVLAGTVTNRNDTVFNDNFQFLAGKNYFYRVYVVDTKGNVSAGSNILNTGDKSPPRASSLSLAQVDYHFITLKWLASSEADFSKYALYRSTDNFRRDTTLVVCIYDRNLTTFTDGNLTAGKNYYYQLRTYDVGGNYSKSSTLAITTKP